MTVRHMRIACWVPKATNTFAEYVIIIIFPLQQWQHESSSTLRYSTYVSFQDLINRFLNAFPKIGTYSLYTHRCVYLTLKLVWSFCLNSRCTCDNQVLRMLTYKLYLIWVKVKVPRNRLESSEGA
jgi:hypothetical protein